MNEMLPAKGHSIEMIITRQSSLKWQDYGYLILPQVDSLPRELVGALWHILVIVGALWHVLVIVGVLWHILAIVGALWHILVIIGALFELLSPKKLVGAAYDRGSSLSQEWLWRINHKMSKMDLQAWINLLDWVGYH